MSATHHPQPTTHHPPATNNPQPTTHHPLPTNSIVVTADDFGIGLNTSGGIIDAHLNGPVTATSVMTVTGDHLRSSAPLLADAPLLETGLHLVLTRCGDKPLLARASSGLVDRDGQFHTNGKLWRLALTGRLQMRAIADEIAAQTERFHKEIGRAPAYVDSHHHAHQLPIVRDALLEVIGHDLLPPITRVTVEPRLYWPWVGSVRLKRLAANLMGKRAARLFTNRWVWANDCYIGMLSRADLRKPFPWQALLDHLPQHASNVEWIVHPGHEDPTLVGRDGYIAGRIIECAALTNPQLQSHWQHLRDRLTTKTQMRKQPTEG